ncbi:MAG: alpha/beta hydrolase [Clostridia bacterium]
MVAYIMKFYMVVIEFLGRIFIFNRNLPKGFVAWKDISYSEWGSLDAYRPADNEERLPVLLYMHGGGWTTGNKATSTRQCVSIAIEGFLVLNVQYRLGPRWKHPSQLADIGSVLGWLMENKDSYNANTDRIFFGGGSSGAHLACLSACIATNETLRKRIGVDFPIEAHQAAGSILVYGAYNMESIKHSGFPMIRQMVKSYTGTKKASEYELKDQISPVHHITDKFPPAFITVGEVDPLYGQSLELMEMLDEKNRPYEKLLFGKEVKNAGHAFLNFHYRDCTRQAYKGIVTFMKKYSKK